MSLQGQIEEMGLGAVIQTLSLNRYRGTLRIETEEVGNQFFFISAGEIVLVRQVKREPVRLGDLLVRAGKITEDDLQEALEAQKRSDGTKRLGATLAELGKIDQDEIDQTVRAKFEEEFLDLFLLDHGRFEFIFGLTPEALFAPEEKLERVTLNTGGLMMEAMRRLDEWQGMIDGLGSLDTIFRNRAQSMGPDIREYDFEAVNLAPAARKELYELLDGTRSLREVIGLAIRNGIASRLETFKFLHALNANELVKPMDFKTLLGQAKKALGGGDVQGAAKYIRAILGRKERLDVGLVQRYLQFLKNQQRPRLAFDEARRFAAQCLAGDEMEDAIALYEQAIATDQNVEVIDRLFYALLRANRRPRAVQVGLKLREHLASDADLSVAVRVCKNLVELDEDNPEVMEFSGLILKRQERNEEAVQELERALARLDPDHERRPQVIKALLELQPERNELRDEQESIELQHAQAQLRREIRRRWLAVGGTLLLVFLLWRGYAEAASRGAVAVVRSWKQEGRLETQSQLRNASLQLQEVHSFTTVTAEAEALKAEIDRRWTELLQAEKAQADEQVIAHKKQEQTAERERKQRERRAAFKTAIAEYRVLVDQGQLEQASKKALAIQEEYGASQDPLIKSQRETLTVFAKVASVPPQAKAYVDGKATRGRTPVVVPIPLGRKVQVRLRRPGYKVVEAELTGTAFLEKTFKLQPGPSWTHTEPAAPLPLVVARQGVVVLQPGGEVKSLRFLDGSVRWKRTVLAKQKVPVAGAAAAARNLIVVRGDRLRAFDLASGRPEWPEGGALDLPGAGPYQAPVTGTVRRRPVVVVAGGRRVVVLNAESGEPLLQVADLPAPVTQPPALGRGWVVLALKDRVVGLALKLSPGAKVRDWPKLEPEARWISKGLVATRPPFAFGGAVFVFNGSDLSILREEDGVAVSLRAPVRGAVLGHAIGTDRVYLLGANGLLCTLTTDGDVLRTSNGPVLPSVSAGPLLEGRDLLLADGKGVLVRLSSSWRRRRGALPIALGGPVTQPLRARGKRVVAVCGRTVCLVEPAER